MWRKHQWRAQKDVDGVIQSLVALGSSAAHAQPDPLTA